MRIIESYLRVAEKADTFSDIFWVSFSSPDFFLQRLSMDHKKRVISLKQNQTNVSKINTIILQMSTAMIQMRKDVDCNVRSMYFMIVNITERL